MTEALIAISAGLGGVLIGGWLEYLRLRSERRHRWAVASHDEFIRAARLVDQLANVSLRWAGDVATGSRAPHPFSLVDLDAIVFDAYHVLGDVGDGPVSQLLTEIRELAALIDDASLGPSPGVGPRRTMKPSAVTAKALHVRKLAEDTRAWLKLRGASERRLLGR